MGYLILNAVAPGAPDFHGSLAKDAPLLRDLLVAVPGGVKRNLARDGGPQPSISGALGQQAGFISFGWQGAASAYLDTGVVHGSDVGGTFYQVINPGTSASVFPWSTRDGSAASSRGWEMLCSASGQVNLRMSDGTSTYSTGNAGVFDTNNGRDLIVIGRFDGTAGLMHIFVREFRNSASVAVPSTLSSGAGTQNIRLHSRGTTYYTAKSGDFAYWRRALSDAEIQLLFAQRFQALLEPEELPIYFTSAPPAGLAANPARGGGAAINPIWGMAA